MKTNFKLLAMAAVAMLAMNSCEKENEMNTGEQKGTPVEFEMGISASTRTATNNTSRVTTWVEGDAVGIFAYAKGTTTSPVVKNAKYVLTGDKWVPAAGSEIYPEAAYDYYAYYPYQEGVSDPANISLAALADQTSAANYAKSDILAAPKTEAEANATTVPLTFKHVYAMVEVQVSGDKVTKQPTSVILKGVKLGGTLNLTATTPTVTLAGDATDVTMLYLTKTENPDAAPFSFRAVVPAQEIAASTPLVTINDVDGAGTDYSMQYSSAVTYDAGKYRQIKVTIGIDNASLTIPATNVSIDPWEGAGEIGGTGTEIVPPIENLDVPLPTQFESLKTYTTNWQNLKINDVTENTWVIRKSQDATTYAIEEDALTLAITYDGSSGATRGSWNNSSIVYHHIGKYETTTYILTFQAKSSSTSGSYGVGISCADDSKFFLIGKVASETFESWERTVTTGVPTTEYTTYTVKFNFAKGYPEGKSSNVVLENPSGSQVQAVDITEADVQNGINIYFYNYSQEKEATNKLYIKDINLKKWTPTPTTEG